MLFLSLRFLHASRFFSGALSAAVFAVYSAGVEPVNAQAPTYKVTEMRPLSGLEAGFNRVHDLNESGQIVGYTSATFNLEQSTPRYFLLNGTNTVEVSVSSGRWSRGGALTLNNLGYIAGTNGSDTGAQAFLNNGLGVFNLGTLGGTRSYAADINDNGVIVGRSTVAGDTQERAFVYSNGKMTDLGTFGGSRSTAASINSAGHVVGSASIASGSDRAFLYRNGVMTNLGTFGGDRSSASASNTSGQVVGSASYANYEYRAFRFANGVMQDIDTLGRDSSANDINEAGDAIGNTYVLSGTSRVLTGFVYRGNGPAQALTPYFGAVSQAKDINNKGQVVGSASGWAGWGDNQNRGFLQHQGTLYDLNNLITPNSGYFIADALRINDKGQIAAVATKNGQQRVLLLSLSNAPIANPDAITIEEDSSAILIRVLDNDTDPNGTPLRISWITPSGHNGHWGVTNNSTAIYYTPRPDFSGTETIFYDVTNGSAEARSYVTIIVTPKPDAPVASNGSSTTDEDTSAKIVLQASDADGDALTFTITRQPSHGRLDAASATFAAGPNIVTYTPKANYNGADSFEFIASDGTLESNTARVDITVKPVSDKPVANAQSVETDEDTAKAITLSGTDVDGDTLTYAIVSNPQHGTLTGDTPNLTYTPAANYNGADSFSFTTNDGTATSNTATVTITVKPVNDAPTANGADVETNEDAAKAITLSGNDVEGDVLTYFLVSQPQRGTLSGTAPNLTYTPVANDNGPDSFSFKVNDGNLDSETATVKINITAVNDAPVASTQNVETNEDTAKAITLAVTDVDGDALTYSIVTPPTQGTLSGSGANRTYTPNADYYGPDSFTFKANDGTADSNTVTVSIVVRPVNDAPTAANDSARTAKDKAITIDVVANSDQDVDGDPLTVRLVTQGSKGSVIITGAHTVRYTPQRGYVGNDSFTYTIDDDKGGTARATVSVSVERKLTNLLP